MPDRVPVGVCGQIIPWNFPLLMLAWKIAPAIALGNTVILKPAEFTPLTALLFAEICEMAGLPKGVVNIVTGDGATGELIVKHPGIDKIAFTGSTEVGRRIREATAGSGKSLTLELGGKSPFIVFDDADLDSAVEGVVDAIWFNQGQVCCAGSRLLVQEGVHDAFVAKLKTRLETLRVGPPLDKAIDVGAIVAPVQLERIRRLVQKGVDEGASLYQTKGELPSAGCFYPPTLLTNVQPASTFARVEIFGPVLVAMTFRTPDEAVALANNTEYGLAASVWSESINLALDIAPKLKAGVVWVNSTNLFDASAGFGGYKESGYGREGGREGALAYTKPRWMKSAKALVVKPTAKPELGLALVGGGIDRTAKMYIGGKQARPDGGYSRPVGGAERRACRRGRRGQPQGHPQRRRGRAQGRRLGGGERAQPRADPLLHRREPRRPRRRVRRPAADPPRRQERQDAARGRCRDRAPLRLRRLGRQVRGRRPPPAVPRPGARHERAGRRRRHRLPGGAGPARLRHADGSGDRRRQHGGDAAVGMAQALIATDFYQVLDTSDVPGGVVNIVTGDKRALGLELAKHDAVDAIWYFGDAEGAAAIEKASAGNLKQTWTETVARDWGDPAVSGGREILGHATQVKNIWIPYGE